MFYCSRKKYRQNYEGECSSSSLKVAIGKPNGGDGRRVEVKSMVPYTLPLPCLVTGLGKGEGPRFLQHGSNVQYNNLLPFLFFGAISVTVHE